MKRAVARGRILPQSLSTDPRMGQLSLKAALLFPLIWINCDDQGRVSGNPHEIKYACCPNIDHISKTDIGELLKELDEQELIKVYATSKTMAIQMLDWWEVQRLQWAYPSEYPPPEGWTDHLRYHPRPKEIITENWPPAGQPASKLLPSKLPSAPAKELPSKLHKPPLTTPLEKERGKRRRKGRLPSALGSRSPPSPTDYCTDINKISSALIENFRMQWGIVGAKKTKEIFEAKREMTRDDITPREPGGKDLAQLRDLAAELIAAGGCPLSYIREAFREAAGQEKKSKKSVSYVRAILLDWLGVPREPP